WWLVGALTLLWLWRFLFGTCMLRENELPPPALLHPLGMPPARDEPPPDRNEPTAAPVTVALPDDPSDLVVILVSGVLWECVSDVALPFGRGKSVDMATENDYLKPRTANIE